MEHVQLTFDPLDVNEVTRHVTSASCGAISLFIGTTRDNFEGQQVVRLEYEAYDSMAEKEMQKICHEMRDKWPQLQNIAIVHRLGLVPVTEASIIVAASSPHRKDSLEAIHWAIDALKASVPIWKKEIYEEGSSAWKENKECKWKNDES
ncbi:hypothetical protein CAPTEDRAFT_175568 [Capitella teleta]|uniref:Molybdopterin synthase catalytic subunit n=1 Tax=Capitella teleta TaxID=283909 RepID=R7U6E8_CAPTE|nr:hypothetical protein CAPTEDRAFT_175568 [Capitella teleta]|eukprot:ELU01559.1 hypothetical protein CAPTEDRAFT_175568 [Capitella teleta]